MFRFFQAELKALSKAAEAEDFALWFADETSFHLNPNSVYAWQEPKTALNLPAERTKVINVAGFINTKNVGQFYEFEGNLNGELFLGLLEDFKAKQASKKCVVVLDRASSHYNHLVLEKAQEWRKENFYLQFLPSYSSELNPIEIVWRFIKHQWLSLTDFLSAEKLKEKVKSILLNFGTQYKINFQT